MLVGNKSKTAKSDRDLWATPWDIFRGVEKLLGHKFDLDACAGEHNAKCARYITAEQDCLVCDWGKPGKNVWINPPYSSPMPFIERAIYQSRENNHFVVMLLPSDISVAWFELCVSHATKIIFLIGDAKDKKSGRISFLHNQGEKKNGNTQGTMLVVFEPKKQDEDPELLTYYVQRDYLKQLGARENE